MYLHIGENFLVPMEKILYILCCKNSFNGSNKDFYEKNKILEISQKLPLQSIVGTSDGILYGSPIESVTLLKRWEESSIVTSNE
jgi:hypothetical protein